MPTFDVTPKLYAERRGIDERTATRMFEAWHSQGKPFVIREGLESKRYPKGKLLRMSREHFESLGSTRS